MLDELSMCSFFSVKFVLGLCVVCRAGHRVYETVRCLSHLPRFQHTYVAAHRLVRSGRLHIGPEEREGKGGSRSGETWQ